MSPTGCPVSLTLYHPENPADCASRGLFPFELLAHELWWKGPSWLQLGLHCWLKPISLPPNDPVEEANEICSHVVTLSLHHLLSLERYSSVSRLNRVTAWVFRFIGNCCAQRPGMTRSQGPLSVAELNAAGVIWLSKSQTDTFLRLRDTEEGRHSR